MKLTKQEKKELKSQAHNLQPTVIFGKNGISDSFFKEVKTNLLAHELIKIKFIHDKENKKAVSSQIALETASEVIDFVGNILILYKKNPLKKNS